MGAQGGEAGGGGGDSQVGMVACSPDPKVMRALRLGLRLLSVSAAVAMSVLFTDTTMRVVQL